ncbi:hypothetical protein [Hyphomicrobium sp. 1Nfss2.1]|uniref:hypothetical protein n=1 Tax=Hyphomicrobium sp. 1Nfss2.1 TaxID=3413936 RepID=UPI003C7D9429
MPISLVVQPAIAGGGMNALERVLLDGQLVILGDTKHGVGDRIGFYSSPDLFATMARAGVRYVAIEMPRVLGRQAMSVETESDIDLFAQDVIRSGRWHFTDPDGDGGDDTLAQYRVLTALGRQVLLARRFGLSLIFYDFNNPLGGFTTQNDPVYRCLAQLSQPVWRRYGLTGVVTKPQRDAAIMRERFSHDDELAAYVENAVEASGGGKVVVIPGYAHAVLPGGLVERLENRLRAKATIVAVLKDEAEDKGFHSFLWQQARMLSIDLSRPPQYYYTIATNALRRDDAPGRYVALDGTSERSIPSVCYQLALDPR